MIEIKGVTKSFEDIVAVDGIDLAIKEGLVFGLVGTNGAGKSTLLRIMSGVIKPDGGEVCIDGERVYDNTVAKEKLFFIADEPYFFQNARPLDVAVYYSSVYCGFSMERFTSLLEAFQLGKERKISTFSKGMKKQLALILGICSGTKYLFCDETFDGLDPLMRQGIKGLMAAEMKERGMTPVIASHNLRELEDICDHVGLLHKGGVLLSRELSDMKLGLQKVQCVFKNEEDGTRIHDKLEVLSSDRRGSLFLYTVRASEQECLDAFSSLDTVFVETLPLTLEEIFISETEVAGYDIRKIIEG